MEKEKGKDVLVLSKLTEANQPYFIKNKDQTINIPVNCIDCIRIYQKINELKEKPKDDPKLWSHLHIGTFDVKTMTVVMDGKLNDTLYLVAGQTYERPRGNDSLKADSSDCNRRGKWPDMIGEYAHLWAETFKDGDSMAHPSIKEVVMGVYEHLMDKVEMIFKDMKDKIPGGIKLYRQSHLKAFELMLSSLNMTDALMEKPLNDR